MRRLAALILCLAALLGGCEDGVSTRRLIDAAKASDDWLTHGRVRARRRRERLLIRRPAARPSEVEHDLLGDGAGML